MDDAALESNLRNRHDRVRRARVPDMPSRRKYIPNPDGRQRPLGYRAMNVVSRLIPTSKRRGLTMWHLMCHIVPMPDMNIRQLRNTRQLKAWLRAGRTVELRERKRVIARIVPERLFPQTRTWPNFAARVRKIFGDRRLPGADLLAEDRDRY